ncbi:uncharacterized protein [Ptychodera flava]|uniref:uncharacterized protein n=1 Tax=Ptychodera flava TaxID=63121 RepID=UPI003969F904
MVTSLYMKTRQPTLLRRHPFYSFFLSPLRPHQSQTTFTFNIGMVLSRWITPEHLYDSCSVGVSVLLLALGLAAILKASEAQNAIKAGNLQQAEASSASARNLTIASVICGIIIPGATLLVYFLVFLIPDYIGPDY